MQRLVVAVAAIIATMGTASAGSVTPAGCSTCTLDAQLYTGGATPFTLENLGTATIPNSRQPIAAPISFPGEVITFPASNSGVYAGDTGVCGGLIRSPFGDADTTDNYLGTVPCDSGVTISYALPQHQLNLLWGTVGIAPVWRDQIMFVFGDGTTGTVLGDDVVASGIAFNSNATVEITTTKPFTTVIFTAGAASFEFVPSVPVSLFAGTPGRANCHGQSVSALAQQFGGLAAAAAALGFSSAPVLQNAIAEYCAG
jgi:hypothetical protein